MTDDADPMRMCGSFEPQVDKRLLDLAREYHERTETFDRTVCTGRIRNGAIMPATSKELRTIEGNASVVRRDIFKRARDMGFTDKEIQSMIVNFRKVEP